MKILSDRVASVHSNSLLPGPGCSRIIRTVVMKCCLSLRAFLTHARLIITLFVFINMSAWFLSFLPHSCVCQCEFICVFWVVWAFRWRWSNTIVSLFFSSHGFAILTIHCVFSLCCICSCPSTHLSNHLLSHPHHLDRRGFSLLCSFQALLLFLLSVQATVPHLSLHHKLGHSPTSTPRVARRDSRDHQSWREKHVSYVSLAVLQCSASFGFSFVLLFFQILLLR